MPTREKMLRRIEREAGLPELVSVLADKLSASDLNSILIEVFQRRAARVSPGRLLREFETNRFCAPARGDPRLSAAWDALSLSMLPPGFVPVELSPVCPLGTCSAVATVSQDKVVAAQRNTEVVADATNVLALACAAARRRLRNGAGPDAATKFATSHRLLRAQAYANPRMQPHFRALHLVSAGRDRGSSRFETESLCEHVVFFARAILAFLGDATQLRISVTDLAGSASREGWLNPCIASLARAIPSAQCLLDPSRASGRGYYRTVCFKIHVRMSDQFLEVADGGDVDWTARLLSDAKERMFISAIGSDRIVELKGAIADSRG